MDFSANSRLIRADHLRKIHLFLFFPLLPHTDDRMNVIWHNNEQINMDFRVMELQGFHFCRCNFSKLIHSSVVPKYTLLFMGANGDEIIV